MYDNLVFYNHFGAGDLFESREFVKEVMRTVPAKEYYYSHQKNTRMFEDIPELKYIPLDNRMNVTRSCVTMSNDLFFNTWIGRDSNYVLPKIGCVVEKNFQMFNDTLRELSLPQLKGSAYDYIPNPDPLAFNIKPIDEFVTRTQGAKRVLICNGMVYSLQAENFPFTGIIRAVAEKHPDIIFVITEDISDKPNNVYEVDSIVKSVDGFNLNEISYLAQFCDVIVGRKSGPAVFAHPLNVWKDGNKKSLSFTYGKEASHFVHSWDAFPLKKYWSPQTSESAVVNEIERIL